MPEHALTAHVDNSDPLQGASDAMGSAVQAVKQGASDAQAQISEAVPAVGRFLGRVIYSSSYAVSYGIVFPVMLVVRVVPKDNAVVHGLVDGALAARDAVAGWGGDPAADAISAPDDHGSEDAEDSKPSGEANSRRRGGRRRTSTKSPRSSRPS